MAGKDKERKKEGTSESPRKKHKVASASQNSVGESPLKAIKKELGEDEENWGDYNMDEEIQSSQGVKKKGANKAEKPKPKHKKGGEEEEGNKKSPKKPKKAKKPVVKESASDAGSDAEEEEEGANQKKKTKKKRSAKEAGVDGEEKKSRKRRKVVKHANAPKKCRTALEFFKEEHEAEVKKEMPEMSRAQINGELASRFDSLEKKERKKYDKLAKHDQERYAKEYDEFRAKHPDIDIPPPPNRLKLVPKKPMSGYLLFAQDFRESHRDLGVTEMMKEAGKEWARLSAEEKEGYNNESKEAKAVYEETLASLPSDIKDAMEATKRLKKNAKIKTEAGAEGGGVHEVPPYGLWDKHGDRTFSIVPQLDSEEKPKSCVMPTVWSFHIRDDLWVVFGPKDGLKLNTAWTKFQTGDASELVSVKQGFKRYIANVQTMMIWRADKENAKQRPLRYATIDTIPRF
eukprot:comp12303_c0_seq1/m.7145 comp12303_c0_seq1/g.7145  ORF comp12303_c0_seq1/g.7145 comp12303_c0_seq1/m.7145 type:complete len:458 (-) comp12303_c0_seq1:135-1508(-)